MQTEDEINRGIERASRGWRYHLRLKN